MKICLILVLLVALNASAIAQTNEVEIYYFYRPKCPKCAIMTPVVENIAMHYPNVKLTKFVVDDYAEMFSKLCDNYKELGADCKKYGASLPVIFIGDVVFMGASQKIIADLEAKVRYCSTKECLNPSEILEKRDQIRAADLGIIIPMLLGNALADAVNPCEFAVLIILLTAIVMSDMPRRKVLQAGLAFTSSVYIVYFAMGIGLFTAVQWAGISWYFLKVVGVIAIIIGILNIKDYVAPGAGGFEMAIPVRWRPRLGALLTSVRSVPGAFFIGFIAAMFLSPCTAGPYVVFISFLTNQVTQSLAIPFLLLYVFIFVFPMLVITAILYLGLSTPEKAERWRQTKIRYMHLIAGVIMVVMGALLLFYI